jgi:hypothetical protein
LPQLEVPTGVWAGDSEELWCTLNGGYDPYSDEELAARYPWRRGYTRQTFNAVIQSYSDGFLLPQHAWEVYLEALMSDIGERRKRWSWWRRRH